MGIWLIYDKESGDGWCGVYIVPGKITDFFYYFLNFFVPLMFLLFGLKLLLEIGRVKKKKYLEEVLHKQYWNHPKSYVLFGRYVPKIIQMRL